jgi:hypothetical protein
VPLQRLTLASGIARTSQAFETLAIASGNMTRPSLGLTSSRGPCYVVYGTWRLKECPAQRMSR